MPRIQRPLILSAGLVALAVPLGGCGPGPEAAAAPPPDLPAAVAQTLTPARTTIRKVTREPAQVEAFETTTLHAKVAGYVEGLAADTGDRIRKGQVLAELDVPELRADLDQKRALVEQAEAERVQAASLVTVADAAIATSEAKVAEVRAATRRVEADVARWKAEYNRTEQLVRNQAVAESLLDETRSKLGAAESSREEIAARVRSAETGLIQSKAERDKAGADVAAAKARIAVARADQARAEALVGFAKILAPFDGVVTFRHIHTGHLTIPGGMNDPLFDVARTDRLRVVAGVPEADAPFIEPGDPAEIRFQALDGRTLAGRVSRTSWSLDQGTRTLRAEIDIENADGSIRPGLYAYVTIVAAERTDVLALPASATFKEAGRAYCVAVRDGRAHRLEIKTGVSDGKMIEILSGLGEAETIIASNPAAIAEGQPIEASR